jgi:hypothetical protein
VVPMGKYIRLFEFVQQLFSAGKAARQTVKQAL